PLSPMPRPLSGRTPLDELTTAIRRVAAVKAALELDVFTYIENGNRSLPAFCRATGFNERAARLLLDALSNMGLLVRTEFEYTLSPTAETFLVKGKREYLGDVLLAQWAWEARGQTARAVRGNKPLNAWLELNQNLPRAPQTWYDPNAFEFAPNANVHVLGFGIEAGLRALGLLQKFARAKLVVLDHSAQLPRLRAFVEVSPMSEWRKRVE